LLQIQWNAFAVTSPCLYRLSHGFEVEIAELKTHSRCIKALDDSAFEGLKTMSKQVAMPLMEIEQASEWGTGKSERAFLRSTLDMRVIMQETMLVQE
jgi:hypothetical protein